MSETYRNHLLALMAPDDLAVLRPHLERMTVEKGQLLTSQALPVTDVYFPETAYLANVMRFSDGRTVETSTVGCEGVSGLAAFLADAPCTWDVVCQIPGDVLRLNADIFQHRIETSTDLLRRALRLTHDYQSQAAQSAACNAIHEVAPRLARWLLLIQDRSGRDNIVLTQTDMATILGVQRTTINAAASALRASGAIAYRRGVVSVRDRRVLEAMACECYEVQRARSIELGLIAANAIKAAGS